MRTTKIESPMHYHQMANILLTKKPIRVKFKKKKERTNKHTQKKKRKKEKKKKKALKQCFR